MKKDIIEAIKKMAQSIDDPMPESPRARKPSAAPAPAAGVPEKNQSGIAPARPSGQHGYPSSQSVKEMQQAILNLANVASSTDVTALDGNKDGRMEGNQSRQIPANDALPNKGRPEDGQMGDKQQSELSQQTKDDKNYLGGSDAFGKFLVQNYIKEDSFIGKQYLNVDVAGNKNREHASMNPTNLRGIIDSIKRVGSAGPKGEKTVDGIWQTRTNNALHAIADLVEAVIRLSQDMTVPLKAYSLQDLANYRNEVPDTWTALKSPQEAEKKAALLTKHLNAMSKLFEQFNTSVVNNQQIRQFIDQKESFMSFKQPVQIPAAARVAGIPGLQFEWIKNPSQNWISLNELSSMENFKKFIRRIGQDEGNPETVKNILEDVANKLNANGTLQETR